jgi:integrase
VSSRPAPGRVLDDLLDGLPADEQRDGCDWVTPIGEHRLGETGDGGWSHLSAHDLRRTWDTPLVEREVEPGLVVEWGGWDDGDAFREVSLGTYSTKAKTRTRAKVDWV